MVNNDTVLECLDRVPSPVDLIVTSIPFGNQYGYCQLDRRLRPHRRQRPLLGADGLPHPEPAAHLAPGRMYCCYVKDRIMFGNVTGEGVPTVALFHAEAIMHGIRHGFQFMGMITVTTDVVRQRTTRPTGSAGARHAATPRRWASAHLSTSCCSAAADRLLLRLRRHPGRAPEGRVPDRPLAGRRTPSGRRRQPAAVGRRDVGDADRRPDEGVH